MAKKIKNLKSDTTIKDLARVKKPNLAKLDLNYDNFRKLAVNNNLSEHERIGFFDSDRKGFVKNIVNDVSNKLELDRLKGGFFLDIGCGAGPLTLNLIERCKKSDLKIVLNDSPEMLNLANHNKAHLEVVGEFPLILEEILAHSPTGYDAVLCYSVFHYIFKEHNIFRFVDSICSCLAEDGIALIGDIPNQSQRNRFFSSRQGIDFHKKFMSTVASPVVKPFELTPNMIDESVLNAIVSRAQSLGCNAYILPQPNNLPKYNRRCDIMIRKI